LEKCERFISDIGKRYARKNKYNGDDSEDIDDNGFEPYIFVGGTLDFLKAFIKNSKGNIAVVEADEYDRSFLSLKSNVLL